MTYRWVDHTSEVELEVTAPEREAVFAQSLTALAELLGAPEGEEETREVRVQAPDDAALLAEWLQELVYLSEAEGFVGDDLERIVLSEGALAATVRGRRGTPRFLVKAVTYHRLALERAGEQWLARVVLDV